MSIASEKTRVTLDELLASEDAGRFEIVDGQLEEVQSNNLAVAVSSALQGLLGAYCKGDRIGEVLGPGAYYQCSGKDRMNARRPDVSFISRERLPLGWLHDDYFAIPPDLAIEVISRFDMAAKVRIKIEEYLQAGVKLAWEVEPESRTVLVHRLDGTTQMLHDRDTLSGGSVVPGFTCKVANFLP